MIVYKILTSYTLQNSFQNRNHIYYLDKDKMKSVDFHPIADYPITTKYILTDSMLIEYGFHYSYFGCIE